MEPSGKQVKYAEDEVALHDSADSAWVISNGNVYDVTGFLEKHPAGADIILPHLGGHIDDVLEDQTSHIHSKAAYSLLETYRLGSLITSDNNNQHKTANGHVDPDELLNLNGWHEDRVDWTKAMLPQVYRLGEDYKKWVHSPVDHKLQLFQSNFVEFFSKTPWYFIPILWVPVVLFSLVLSWINLSSSAMFCDALPAGVPKGLLLSLAVTVSFGIGVLIWTLLEYFIHRFLFHLDPRGDSPFLITLHFFLHGQHHKVPFDSGRLVFPPVAAAVFAFIFYLVFSSIFPHGVYHGVFAGGVGGYVMYDLIHYYLHHGTPKRGTYFYRLKQYHITHHFEDQAHGFGISSKLWDYPFNTTFKSKVS